MRIPIGRRQKEVGILCRGCACAKGKSPIACLQDILPTRYPAVSAPGAGTRGDAVARRALRRRGVYLARARSAAQ